MIAGSSKCDFRNLGEILSGYIFFSKNNIFFQDIFFSKQKKFETKNNFSEKSLFFSDIFANLNIENSKILKIFENFDFSKFWNFDFPKIQKNILIFNDFFSNFFFQKKSENVLRENFCLEKNILFFEKNIYPLRIFPRFRKSHLEDPAIIIATLRRSKREIRLKITFFWVALHINYINFFNIFRKLL